jgi:predicted DCC family thiol-disulfide oxidoreductase YuxK
MPSRDGVPGSAYSFALFRWALGLFLFLHFLRLMPYARELFSSAGMLPDPALSPLHGYFPNLLSRWDSPAQVKIFLAVAAALSLLLARGVWRRAVALPLWYAWAALLDRNPFAHEPASAYLGWMLLAVAAIPGGEPRREWRLPAAIFQGAWLLLLLGYSMDGLAKLISPSWVDGNALGFLLHYPLARDSIFRLVLLMLPGFLLKLLTWSWLALEILAAPLGLFPRGRKFFWTALLLLQLFLLPLLAFGEYSAVMLLMHLFTFDPAWFPARQESQRPIVFFDGVCGLCDRVVSRLLDADTEGVFALSPLQGQTAERTLSDVPRDARGDYTTLVLYEDGREWKRSDAVLRIFARLGGIFGPLSWLRVVPRPLRDLAYDLVAGSRFHLFGRRETCRLPTPEERDRFLD